MKITITKTELMKGISAVQKAVAIKTTMPILTCLYIEAAGSDLKLVGNNLELGIETTLDATVLEDGSICVDAKLFGDIIRKLPESIVELTTINTQVNITCERAKFNIPYREGSEFSQLPDVDRETEIKIASDDLRDAIRQTIFCTSQNENQKMMTGCNFEVDGSNMTVCAIDGHRIARRKFTLNSDYQKISAIIPAKSLQEVSKLCGTEGDVEIYFTKSHALFQMEDTRIVTRLIEGEYYKVANLLSLGSSLSINADKEELMGILDRASLLIQETDKKPVIIKVVNDTLYVRLDSTLGSMNEEMDVKKDGEDLIIGLNPRFVMEALRAIDDEEITIYMQDSKNPCTIKDIDESYTYVILPISINPDMYK